MRKMASSPKPELSEVQNSVMAIALNSPKSSSILKTMYSFRIPAMVLGLALGARQAFMGAMSALKERGYQTGVDESNLNLPAYVYQGIENFGKTYDEKVGAREEEFATEHFRKLLEDIQFHTEKLVYAHELFNREVRDKVSPACSLEEQERLTQELKKAVVDLGQDMMNAAGNKFTYRPEVPQVIDSCDGGMKELRTMSEEKNLPPIVLEEVEGYLALLPSKLAERKVAHQNEAGDKVTSL